MTRSAQTKSAYDRAYRMLFRTEAGTQVMDEVYGPGGNIGQFAYADRGQLERFASHLHLGRSSRVLDVCCGPGAVAAHLARRFSCSLTGIDLSTEAIALARERDPEAVRAGRLRFLEADAAAYEPGDLRFDAVYSVDALALVPRKWEVLERSRRSLSPGGWLGITELVSTGRLPRGGAVSRVLEAQGRIYPETAGTYRRMLIDLGFADVELEDLGEPWLAQAPRWARSLRHRAEALVDEVGSDGLTMLVEFFETLAEATRAGYLTRIAIFGKRP